MPQTVEMIVGPKVPDNTAITALQTLQKIGFDKIRGVKRSDYYSFSVEGDAGKFRERICKVDILVNANKHLYEFSVRRGSDIHILVKNINDDGSAMLAALRNRLGFRDIKKAEKSVLWSLSIDADEKESRKIAEKAANELLVNAHYQEYTIL